MKVKEYYTDDHNIDLSQQYGDKWYKEQDSDEEYQKHCEELLKVSEKEFLESLDEVPF